MAGHPFSRADVAAGEGIPCGFELDGLPIGSQEVVFLWFICRILQGNPKKELLRILWVSSAVHIFGLRKRGGMGRGGGGNY